MVLTLSTSAARPAVGASGTCDGPEGWIIAERDAGSRAFVAGPAGETAQLPVPGVLTSAVSVWDAFQADLTPRQWAVEATTDEKGYTFTVARAEGPSVIEVTFDRRIELAASAVSPSGRYTIFVQANNLASEVTVLDAERAEAWTVSLPHDATLAAFAISIHVDAGEGFIAISEQRASGTGPETWYIDPQTQQVSQPVPGFVVAWLG